MKYENSYSDGDCAVGNIKSRPVQVSYVEIKKINNLAESYSIDQVACRAAKYQCKACGKQ